MNAKQKTKWLRSEPYLAWVRTLPSVVSGTVGCDAHHLTGYRSRGNSKVHDFWTFSLTNIEHNLGKNSLHSGVATWEHKFGPQWWYVAHTLDKAIKRGVLKHSDGKYFGIEDSMEPDLESYCEMIVANIQSGEITINKKVALGRETVF